MSHKETAHSIGHLDAGGSLNASLPKLAEQARQAYEQKRTKDCLDLTRAILLIDPDNSTAHWIRSSIQSEMQRDLENARAFFREAQIKESPEKTVDSNPLPVAEPALPKSILVQASHFNWKETMGEYRLVLASVVIVLGIAVAGFSRFTSTKANSFETQRIPAISNVSKPVEELNTVKFTPPLQAPYEEVAFSVVPPSSIAVPAPPPVVDPPPSPAAQRIATAPPIASAPPAAAKPSERPVPPPANGTLAVSSPASIDIYKDGTYIGSAPVSLELPAGSQTLEYRHGKLSRKVTHLVSSNETTRATIDFDVDVQINSRPWAEVFLDGLERKDLGQTPLSGVRVPIGSVLVFENPGFSKKKYRVTGNEAGIQNVFP